MANSTPIQGCKKSGIDFPELRTRLITLNPFRVLHFTSRFTFHISHKSPLSPYIKNVSHGRHMGLPLLVVPIENSHFTYYISHLTFHISHQSPMSPYIKNVNHGRHMGLPLLVVPNEIHILHITFHTEDPEFHTGLFKLNPFWVLHFKSHLTSHISQQLEARGSKLAAKSPISFQKADRRSLTTES